MGLLSPRPSAFRRKHPHAPRKRSAIAYVEATATGNVNRLRGSAAAESRCPASQHEFLPSSHARSAWRGRGRGWGGLPGTQLQPWVPAGDTPHPRPRSELCPPRTPPLCGRRGEQRKLKCDSPSPKAGEGATLPSPSTRAVTPPRSRSSCWLGDQRFARGRRCSPGFAARSGNGLHCQNRRTVPRDRARACDSAWFIKNLKQASTCSTFFSRV